MRTFQSMRLAVKLSLSFALVTLFGLIVAVIGRMELAKLSAEIEVLSSQHVQTMISVGVIKDNANVAALAVRNMALAEDSEAISAEYKRLEVLRASNGAALKKLKVAVKSPEGLAKLEALNVAREPYLKVMTKAMALAVKQQQGELRQVLSGDLPPLQVTYFQALDNVVVTQQQLLDESAKQARQDAQNAGNTMLVITALAAIFSAVLAWLVVRDITTSIGGEPAYAAGIAHEVAAGNLFIDIRTRAGDTSSIVAALAHMRDSLVSIVDKVRLSSDNIATGSIQIASGSIDLSQRTEEQASNLQQTAASMEQIHSTVKHNAEAAGMAVQLATAASMAASRGGEVVNQVVETMAGISSSSRRIAEIIGVIDGIAFQTNILALNAAVEAARAGEQGRGFSVVAAEVRALAQRSANAAKEIKSLIAESVDRVDAGASLADGAGVTIRDVVLQVKRVADLIGEIGSATREQTQGIGQVSDAIGQLDDVTQQNAALVEQSTAAADSLRQQASELTGLVSVFKLMKPGFA